MKKSAIIGIVVVIVIIVFVIFVSKNGKSQSYVPVNSQPPAVQTPVISVPVATSTTATSSVTTSSNATTTQKTLVLNTATNKSLGVYLVATNGMTLYKYAKDTAGVSNCSGQCTTSWPPYIVSASSSLMVGLGITGSVSTITRTNGTKQLTYKGLPLYFWRSDSKVGDTTGQKVNGFSVVKP